MHITEAVENYLEVILMLSEQQTEVHAVDICGHLGYSRPTVSIALRGLREKGLVIVDKHNAIFLTEAGKTVAEGVYARHKVLAKVLMRLGVAEEIAYQDACKMEHDISQETFLAFQKFLQDKP